MKKIAIAFLLAGTILSIRARGAEIRLAFQAGSRSIKNSEINDVYGKGHCYFPSLSVLIWKGLFLGAGWELAGKRSGTIGEYAEPTTFKMTGFQAFAGYEMAFGRITPYVQAGFGSFSYEQTVDSIAALPVKETKGAAVFAAGARFDIWKGIFVSAEAKHVALKVKPYDVEVDLGGWRFLGGVGWAFGI